MDDDAENRSSIRRRRVLASVGGIAIPSGVAGTVAGKTTSPDDDDGTGSDTGRGGGSQGERNDRDEYPRIKDSEIPDEPITAYATQIALHPNQRRAAITTGVFGDGLQLYVLQRVDGRDSVADEAWRITDTDRFVAAMEWTVDNRLRYDVNFTRYERKLPPSHKRFEPTVVDELSFEGVNSL